MQITFFSWFYGCNHLILYYIKLCFIKKFKTLICERLNMKQFEPEFLVQNGQIKCKIFYLLINWTLEKFIDLQIALRARNDKILLKIIWLLVLKYFDASLIRP